MEPISPGPHSSAEKMGMPKTTEVQGSEHAPGLSKPEKHEVQTPSIEASQGNAAAPMMPILPPPTQATTTASTATPSDTPLVANDDDVMEKEWVQRAKKIVAQTRHDPYEQEKEVSKLQAAYVKKRYGKEIKVSGD